MVEKKIAYLALYQRQIRNGECNMYEIFVYKDDELIFSIKVDAKTDIPGIWDEFVADGYEMIIKDEYGDDETEYLKDYI